MSSILADQHNVPMSGPADAVSIYDRAIDRLLRFHPEVLAQAQALTLEHPDVPMGHALSAYLFLMGTDAADLTGAAAAAELLRDLASHPRELLHAAAVDAWLAGDWSGAAATLDDVLQRWPADLLALALGHQLDFFLGDAGNLRDRVGRSLPELDPGHPHTGFVRGMQAFGLEESGHYGQAESAGLQAVETNPDDVWAIHAVVHTFEMQGRVGEGLRFMLDREGDWGSGNLFTVHNWWHLALYALEAGDVARALALYDEHIHHPASSDVPIELLDASALLWRFHLDGVTTGGRFGALATAWAPTAGAKPWYVFNQLHAVMAFAGAGWTDEARAMIDGLIIHVASARGTNATMTAEVGIPACEAVLAFAEGRYHDVISELGPVRRHLHRFGGSHAQRDALQRTLLESALRAGEFELARALTAERLSTRERASYNWLQRSRALQGLGDHRGSEQAAEQGELHRQRFASAMDAVAHA